MASLMFALDLIFLDLTICFPYKVDGCRYYFVKYVCFEISLHCITPIIIFFLNFFMQAANIEAETAGIPDGEYQLTKHEFSSLGRGKYSGMVPGTSSSYFKHITRANY
jgi:hypothetical protein